MARYVKDSDGNLICTAGGTRTWICTKAEHDRKVAAGTAPNNCVVATTDDYSESGTHITDGSWDIVILNEGMLITANNTIDGGSIDNQTWTALKDFSSYIPTGKTVSAWYGSIQAWGAPTGITPLFARVNSSGRLDIWYSGSTEYTPSQIYIGTIFLPFV